MLRKSPPMRKLWPCLTHEKLSAMDQTTVLRPWGMLEKTSSGLVRTPGKLNPTPFDWVKSEKSTNVTGARCIPARISLVILLLMTECSAHENTWRFDA